MKLQKKVALLNELLTEEATIENIVSRMENISSVSERYVYVNIETSIVGIADKTGNVTGNIVSFGNCAPAKKSVIKRIKEEIDETKKYL